MKTFQNKSFWFLAFILIAVMALTGACSSNTENPVGPPKATATPTATITPTITNSPTITPTVTVTATIDTTFPAQGFEGSSVPAGWYTEFPSLQSAVELSTAEAHTEIQSLASSITFTGAYQYGGFYYFINPPVNLTGETISFWYFIDQLPAATGNQIWVEADSLYGNGGGLMSSVTVGAWTQATWAITYLMGQTTPSAVNGIRFVLGASSTATGPFNTVNLYIDDVTIQ